MWISNNVLPRHYCIRCHPFDNAKCTITRIFSMCDAKKCFSIGNPKSWMLWATSANSVFNLNWLAAPSEKCICRSTFSLCIDFRCRLAKHTKCWMAWLSWCLSSETTTRLSSMFSSHDGHRKRELRDCDINRRSVPHLDKGRCSFCKVHAKNCPVWWYTLGQCTELIILPMGIVEMGTEYFNFSLYCLKKYLNRSTLQLQHFTGLSRVSVVKDWFSHQLQSSLEFSFTFRSRFNICVPHFWHLSGHILSCGT